MYATSPSYSIPDLSLAKTEVHPNLGGSHHAKNSSTGSTVTGMQDVRRISADKRLLDTQAATGSNFPPNINFPPATNPLVPEHMNCSVQLKFDQNVRNQEIFDTIRTGAIYSYSRAHAENRLSIVKLIFMTRDGAQKYISTTQNNNILIRNKRILATWSPHRVGPCGLQGVSRVLKVTGPASSFNLRTFIRYAKGCCWIDIIHQREMIVGTECEVMIEFGSFGKQAEVVWEAIMEDGELRGWRVEFLRDPCDGDV
ncbi:hypothetical protein SBOR_7893 [Sclerotinia borealis F-4128]|uniref:Uncharacterized protein n=1 Tax=Sclerotinia borealis (strain F-4128) TaxID=1432307 RepID=W9CAY6_SCLBF|nr:hypothetical protein SBOR_7893 [Sclerotinia borealis F-4128]